MGSVSGKAADGARVSRLVVLVVEDDVVIRMLACEILEDGGYNALEAVNAQEALALINARPDIALIFTDVDMPGEINGLGLSRLVAMRAPTLPILITSGATALSKADLPPNGRFLQKPYSPSVLLETVQAMALQAP